MKLPLRQSVILLLICAALCTFSNAEAKLFKSSKKSQGVQPIDIVKEFPPNTDAEAKNEAVQDPDPKTFVSKGDLKEKSQKNKKSADPDYSEFQIPLEAFMHADHHSHPEGSMQGSVSKDMALSLADCLELALTNNPKIRASYSGAAAEKSKNLQIISNYTPRVNLSTGFSRIKPDNGGKGATPDPFNQYLVGNIGVSQLIYDFGYTQNQYTINKLNYETSKENIDATVNNIIYDVKNAYYYLLYMLEQERIANEAVEYFEKTYNQAKAFWEVG
ncbi:type I secretion outer membrane protein, partial [Candidatus Gastranaerophilus sp. (ex Termes propinquus)]